MYNRQELERVGSEPAPLARSIDSAVGLYSKPANKAQSHFGMQASFNPLGAVSVEAAKANNSNTIGPCAPPNVKNPFLHHISENKHYSTNAPHYIPPQKRHLLREYLKRSSIRFYNKVAADERMSSNLAAARAGLTLDVVDDGKSLIMQPEQPRSLGIKLERASLPPHLRREFDSLAKATQDIRDRDRKQKYALKSEKSPDGKLGLYKSIKNEFQSLGGPPAQNLKETLDFQRHNFKLGYKSESGGELYPLANGGDSQGGVNSDIANLKDFEGMMAPGTPLRTQSMSPNKAEPYLHSPTVLGGKIQLNYEFVKPRPFQATKDNMRNVKNESAAILSQSGHQRRVSASQSTATFIRHNAPPPKGPPPGLTFHSNVSFPVTEPRKAASMMNSPARPESCVSRFSSFNKLWEKYERLGAEGPKEPTTGPGNAEFAQIKHDGTHKHFHWDLTANIGAPSLSHVGLSPPKQLDPEQKRKRDAILAFMHRRHLPLGGTAGGPPTTIQGDALDDQAKRTKLAGKKAGVSEVSTLGKRDQEGRVIGEKVMGSSIPIEQAGEGPQSAGVTTQFFPEKRNTELSVQNSTNKYFRAAEMAHYHQMGLHQVPKTSEKRVAFSGAIPTNQEQEFTRKANKEHIEKQHFQWNKSFDLAANDRSFNSVNKTLEMYSRVKQTRSDSDPLKLTKTLPPAGSVVNSEGKAHREAFVALLRQINEESKRPGSCVPSAAAAAAQGPGGSFLGGAPGAQFRSHFQLTTHNDDGPPPASAQTISIAATTRKLPERSVSVARMQAPPSVVPTLREIKEENDKNLRHISKDGWSSHMVWGIEKRVKPSPLYGKFFSWRQPVVDM